MKKLVVIFFSAALGISFLFIGFGSYFGQSYLIKVGKTKITSNEFLRDFENYKVENELSNLSEEENLFTKIQFLNQFVNELVFEEYLKNKIDISETSKKVILKKTLNNNEMFNNLNEGVLQNYLKEITSSINLDIFNNSLEANKLLNLNINQSLLKEKELNIYEIINNQGTVNKNYEDEYFDNYDLYKVSINEYDIKEYVLNELINQENLKDYYEENINNYTKNNNYTYEQIILEKISTENFESLKEKENIQFKKFENIDEKLILPQVKLELEKIKINEISKPIEIGNKFFYIKKIDFNESFILDFEEVKEEITSEIVSFEINNFDYEENLIKLEGYLKENNFYSNSFNFLENIPDKFDFIAFNNFEGQTIYNEIFYDYSVINIEKDDLSEKIKNKFLISYSNYQNNIDSNTNEENLEIMGTVKVNYFTDSLTIKGFLLPDEDLEKIISIKEDKLLKIVLPNEVIYLRVNSTSKIEEINIKQNIINLIYSIIIDQIKKDIEIEVNNEQLLKL
mgnify:FL=1